MRTSKAGIDFITCEEGVVLKTYKCQAGVPTIGVGHTGPDVKDGMVITKERAMEMLSADLQRFETCVGATVPTPTQCQFDALVSFAFNVGCAAFKSSTLVQLLRDGKISEAAEQFARWNKGGGKVLPVLVGRRAREKRLFLEGRYK